MKITISTIFCFLCLSTLSFAVPYLQLDASDSEYIQTVDNKDVETVVSRQSNFDLYALVNPFNQGKKENIPATVYYISISLVKEHEGLAAGLTGFGTFEFDGNQYSISDTVYGTPNGVPTHDIFSTYYYEFSFEGQSLDAKAKTYNVQDQPGGFEPAEASASDYLYYAKYEVDVSNLSDDYELHFDLYTKNADGTMDKFAPWSHDAESGGDIPPPGSHSPEPATLLMFGLGLLMLSGAGRKKNA